MTEHGIRLSSSFGSLIAVAKQGARERRLLASVIALVFLAAIAVPVIVFSGILSPGDKHSLRAESRIVPPPTVAQPFGSRATEITLADASNKLGAPVTLPNTPLASASNLGPVWAMTIPGHDYEIALTFPSSSLIVYYERPVPYPEPPATMY